MRLSHVVRTSGGLLAALLAAVACSSSSGPGAKPTAIRIAPFDTTVAIRTTVQYRAALLDSAGDTIPGLPVTWESSDTTVATISSSGLATSKAKPFGTFIYARYDTALWTGTSLVVLDSILVARTKLPNRAYAAAISSSNVAYVSQSDLAKIVRADLPAKTFSTSVTVGDTPTEIAFNSTGTRLYVTNQYSGSISVINVASNTVIDEIPVGNRPFEVIVEPGDSILWTGKIDSLYGIRLATKAIIARFQIGDVGNGVAIARDTLLYVSTHGTGTVVEINLRTRTQGRTFNVGGIPQKLAVSPNGTELYIANESGYVQFWDLSSGLQIGSNLVLPSAAYGLARRPTNGYLYVTGAYFGGGYIHVVNPVSRTLIYSAVVGGSTRHVVFNADGSIGVIPNEGGWVDFLK